MKIDVVRINKELLVSQRQSGFLWRIFIINYIIFFVQEILYYFIPFQLELLTRIGFIVFESLFLIILNDETFIKGIQDLHSLQYLFKMKQKEKPLLITHIVIFLIYIISVICSFFYDRGGLLIIFISFVVEYFVLQRYIDKKNKKRGYFVIQSKYKNSKSKDGINLEKDLKIVFKNGMTKIINLLYSEFFICENNDILIIVSENINKLLVPENHIIIGVQTNVITETSKFSKEIIRELVIEKNVIRYTERDGWKKQ